ncbi:hypothetical protein BJX63DRAFT_306732 [Aspergillus granulosus]|uniref:Uncharacterized protein n=1 Tax=Aspergillus granulosus TaxID=176169 RepID=A0ABR4H5E3_9EURO
MSSPGYPYLTLTLPLGSFSTGTPSSLLQWIVVSSLQFLHSFIKSVRKQSVKKKHIRSF